MHLEVVPLSMLPRFGLAFVVLSTALLFSGRARADAADPAIGYVFGQYAIPYHYAVLSRSINGQRETVTESGRRPSPVGLSAFGFGAGIGYTGLNLQLDVRNALDVTSGTLTVGLRGRIAIGRFEVWARAGIGPGVVWDNTLNTPKTTGAIASQLEAGADYFVVNRRLALGLKALATPQYHFPSDYFVDFGGNIALRLIL